VNSIKQFSGLWGVVLGGSSGLGYAAVKKLSHHGMNIALLYRETAAAEKILKKNLLEIAATSGVTILPYNINALDAEGRKLFIEEFTVATGEKNKVRMLLHAIARGNLKPLIVQENTMTATNKETNEILSVEDIQLTTYAMSTSLLDWTRLFLREELFYHDARIIGLTSEGAHKYWEGYAAVSVAKASLESLATYMAVEMGRFGLKTNLIQAGVTNTPSLKRIPGSDKLVEMTTARNPLGRMTMPEDVANAIYLLCTDEASWINGSVIHVDGGEHAVNFKTL
jgi:enoyl-[acyl-carrier protein] reductase III